MDITVHFINTAITNLPVDTTVDVSAGDVSTSRKV